jgi:hypothetical protein
MSDTENKIAELRRKMEQKVQKFDRPIVGWNPEKVERKEGERWTDHNGKLWERKNGISQSISKLQGARTPWFCPKCTKTMGHRFDSKFYWLYNQCYDCTINQHTKMMLNGTWEEFEKKNLREREKSFLKDKIQEHKEYMRTFKVPQIHFQDGGWQELATLEHFKDMFETLKEDIKVCENRLKQIEEEELKESQTQEKIDDEH